MHKFLDLLKRFRNDERGAFLALFGVLAVVLIATAGATVDFTSMQNARTRAQVALDAAALALQPEIYGDDYTTEEIRAAAEALMLNRLNDASITASVTSAVPDLDTGTLSLTATLKAPLIFVALVGISEMNMTLVSQATKGSQDLEVAVALDVTGSMLANDKIGALKAAAAEMVDILVLDQQEPTYTKMALIPYSMGVNVGSNANAIRGAVPAAQPVIIAAWQTGTTTNINNAGITRASPAVVTTSAAHGLATGETVWLNGIANGTNATGWTGLNNRSYTVTVTTATAFRLNNTNTSGYTAGSTAGSVSKCTVADCEIVIMSPSHGFVNNDAVYFTGVGGMTQLNGNLYLVANASTTTFSLDGSVGPMGYSAFTAGGSAWCTKHGCQYYRFRNPGGGWRFYDISTCVTERVSSPNQSTDAAPSTTFAGLNYPSDNNGCLSAQIVPLSSDKTLLKNTISNLVAGGSTAGQIGLAWAWYMLAPNFASLWPTGSQPAPYNSGNLLKVVVLMTDGSFNTAYCTGVIAADSLAGSGSSSDHINCNATNGSPFAQAEALCDAMKSPDTGIIVYTVGYDIADQTAEKNLLAYCATDSSKAYLANDALSLSEAFKDIAQDIAALRLTE